VTKLPTNGRSVEEWVGKTPDSVPPRVRLRVFQRYDGVCYLSGRKILAGEAWEVEHVRPLGLGGENRERNLRPALVEPHKAKTAVDRDLMSKADRIAKKHRGLWPASKRPLKSRGFEPSRR
jgi:5-methylcytosine-specific restriction protein A